MGGSAQAAEPEPAPEPAPAPAPAPAPEAAAGATDHESVWGSFGEDDDEEDWMTKRKDKKGGALKGRALAAKDAVKSKATAVPGAGSVLNAVAEAADVANALAKEAEQQIGNRPGGSTEGAPPAPSKPTEAQVGDNFIHLTWSMPSDAGDGPFIFEVQTTLCPAVLAFGTALAFGPGVVFFPAAFSIAKNGRQSAEASDENGFGKAAENWFGCQLSYGKKYVGTWRSVPCSPTEEGFGAMKEWTTPLDGLEPGEKYLICAPIFSPGLA